MMDPSAKACAFVRLRVHPFTLRLLQEMHWAFFDTRTACFSTPITLCQSVQAASASGRAPSSLTSSRTRTARSFNPYMLHLRQDVHRAVIRCQGHAQHASLLRTCCICVSTCTEQPDVVRDMHISFCHFSYAASASGRAPSGHSLSEARISRSVTPFMLHLRQGVHRAARRCRRHAQHASLLCTVCICVRT
jgi:hypothetical protein